MEDNETKVTVEIDPNVDIKVETEALSDSEETVERKINLEDFVKDAKLLDPELLSATIGPILFPRVSLWDVVVQKMNTLETNEINKVYDSIQLVLNELKHLLNEVNGLLDTTCKRGEYVESIVRHSEDLAHYLDSDIYIETKDLFDIPPYYLSMMSEMPVKLEEPLADDKIDYEDYDDEDDEDEPKAKKAKKKTSSTEKKTKLRRRPNKKNVPPDLRLAADEEQSVCDSRRRRYCEKCTRGFADQKRLDAHLANGECPGKPNPKWHYTNIGARRLYCIHPDCLGPSGKFDIRYIENSFNSICIAKGYFTHVMDKHATPENCVFPCNTCSKKFPNTWVLKYHKDYCGENFTCRFCGRGVASKRLLVQHEAGHAQKMKCPHCDHATHRKSLLDAHIRTVHLNLRPEICQLCGKAFKTKKQIAAHILTHSDIKRYSCDICGAKLKNITCHRSHMMNVHGHKIPCDICGKFLYKEEGVRRHKRQEHGVEIWESK